MLNPDDEADAEQSGREVDAEETDRAVAEVTRDREGLRREPQARQHELEDRARAGRDRERLEPAARVLADLQHFGGRDAFRELQALVEDQRAAERHGEKHAEQATEACDREHPPVIEVGPVAHDHERRDREDRARRNRGGGGGAGRDDVVLEDARAAHEAQHAHRDDGRGDRGRDREPREEPEVGVRRREQHGEDQRKDDGAYGQLRRVLAFMSDPPFGSFCYA